MDYFLSIILLLCAVKYLCCDNVTSMRRDNKIGSCVLLQEETEAKEQLPEDLITWLLTANADKLRTVDVNVIRKGLWAIRKFDLQPNIKELIWEKIKGSGSPKNITAELIQEMKFLITHIPEPDLFHLNLSDWHVVEFLGKQQLSRRKMGILAMAYSKLHPDEDIVNSVILINHIRGLLCGFSLYDLGRITPDTIVRLDREVYHYLLACTRMQVSLLYNSSTSPEAYGPSYSWSKEDVHRLGLLFIMATTEEIVKVRPRSFSGLSRSVLALLTPEQVQAIEQEQVRYLKEDALEEYRQRTKDTSGASSTARGLPQNMWCVVLTFWRLRRQP